MSTGGPIHLVLSGGGVKCLAYAGAITALHDAGFTFRSVSTVSAGTFIGAWLCAGVDPVTIKETIINTDLSDLVGGPARPTPLHRFWTRAKYWRRWPFALYAQDRVVDYFNRLVDPKLTLGELKIPFATAGVDLINDRLLVYTSESHRNMPVGDAVRIAMALPLIYPPHEADDRIVVDASIVSHSPVWLAADAKDALPIVVLRPTKPPLLKPPRTLPKYISRMMETGTATRDHYFLTKIPRVELIEIEASDLRFDDFGLSRAERGRLIVRGERAASDAIPKLGKRTSVSLSRRLAREGGSVDRWAEHVADEKMRVFAGNLSRQIRTRVFISYSGEDREWVQRLRGHLSPRVRNPERDVWDDSAIPEGESWRDRIQEALQTTKVAVLLVTPNFLSSNFIMETELPHFLEARRTDDLIILWVPVEASDYGQTPLSDLQAASDPARPLAGMDARDQERALEDLALKIDLALS